MAAVPPRGGKQLPGQTAELTLEFDMAIQNILWIESLGETMVATTLTHQRAAPL